MRLRNLVQGTKPEPKQCNTRVLRDERLLKPFREYIEDQIKADAKRIEEQNEQNNFYIFKPNDYLKISLNNISRDALSKSVDLDGYTVLEKFIGFDESIPNEIAYYTSLVMGVDTETYTNLIKLVKYVEYMTNQNIEEIKKQCVLPIDFNTACIYLDSNLRVKLICSHLTKPYTISISGDNLILSWVKNVYLEPKCVITNTLLSNVKQSDVSISDSTSSTRNILVSVS